MILNSLSYQFGDMGSGGVLIFIILYHNHLFNITNRIKVPVQNDYYEYHFYQSKKIKVKKYGYSTHVFYCKA